MVASHSRRGPRYEEFCRRGYGWKIERSEMTQIEVADEMGLSAQSVSRYMAAWLADHDDDLVGWEPRTEHKALLEDFAAWRATFFTDEWGEPYQTTDFHLRWIDALLDSMERGTRKVILSPPRHGKTQLLIHFAIWCILRSPNVRIMWIGGNEAIARQSVEAVMDELENNDALKAAYLPAGGSFRPTYGSGKSWSKTRLTVSTRTQTGIKSPTLAAVGKGGKILSRDADLIVFDDIVDDRSTATAEGREADKHWLDTQVSSRKEAHTGMVGIGSRQHYDDLWGSLLDNDQSWSSIVERAHSLDCGGPRHEYMTTEHDSDDCDICAQHADCVLWPGKRTYGFLADQQAAMDNDRLFEMVYMNVARPTGAILLTREQVELCYSTRVVGERPDGTMLVAGLDPAQSGQQAAVLVAYDPKTRVRHIVDLAIQEGGGTPGFRELMREWYETYALDLWMIEQNSFQHAILQDRDVAEFSSRHNIGLRGDHTLAANKFDPAFGVGAMLNLYKKEPPLVDLPMGDAGSRDKIGLLVRQLLDFDPEARGRHRRHQDLVMAAWFPEQMIRYWRYSDRQAEARHTGRRTPYPTSRVAQRYRRVA